MSHTTEDTTPTTQDITTTRTGCNLCCYGLKQDLFSCVRSECFSGLILTFVGFFLVGTIAVGLVCFILGLSSKPINITLTIIGSSILGVWAIIGIVTFTLDRIQRYRRLYSNSYISVDTQI